MPLTQRVLLLLLLSHCTSNHTHPAARRADLVEAVERLRTTLNFDIDAKVCVSVWVCVGREGEGDGGFQRE